MEVSETNNWRAFGVDSYRDTDGNGIPDSWEQQYLFESDPDFVPVVAELAQSDPAVQMRLPKAPLRLGDGLSQNLALPPPARRGWP